MKKIGGGSKLSILIFEVSWLDFSIEFWVSKIIGGFATCKFELSDFLFRMRLGCLLINFEIKLGYYFRNYFFYDSDDWFEVILVSISDVLFL